MNLSVTDVLSISHQRTTRFSSLTPNAKFRRVSTDSRTVGKGDLFIAIRGEKFDGHDFINVAKQRGARAAVVDARWFRRNPRTPLPCIVVKHTLDAFGEIARAYRRKFSIPILVIGGSNGKTTTKDLIAHTLGTSFTVLKTEANFNNQIGLPHMLLRLTNKHTIAVLEIGTNHPGEIAWLTNVAEPTHALITNIGREHLEFFHDLDGVAREELSALSLTETLGGFGFLNYDDPYIRPLGALFEEWSISYGTKRGADVIARSAGLDPKGRHRIDITIGQNRFKASTQLIADYAPNLVAAATAVALHFGIRKSKIKHALESYKPHSKRMEVIRSKKGITFINDAYNANPESFRSALKTVAQMKTKGKKIVVAGDMFELGSKSTTEHRMLGKEMGKLGFSKYYFTGKAMKHAHEALNPKASSLHATKEQIVEDLRGILKRGDILLVKGSRGMRMEEILDKLS